MLRRTPVVVLLAMLVLMAACTNKKVVNPLASVGSKQPDKVLFDRAMDALKHNKFDVARLTLQTLINTYPDSEYIARAKLGVADSWYAEGGSTAMAQAEIEYNDFKTFFPEHARGRRGPAEDCQHPLPGDGETGPGLHACAARARGISQPDHAVPGQQAGASRQAAPHGSAGSAGGTGIYGGDASIT
jgi:hypothetical protein